MKLFYRKGGTLNFVWLPVFANAADLPAKRMALFTAGYTTILLPDGSPAPATYAPVGAWAGKGLEFTHGPAA